MGPRRWFPGRADGRTRRPPTACPGEPPGVRAVVRRPRGRPADALPGRPDAARRDRAVLRRAGARLGLAVDGDPRPRYGPADRDVRPVAARQRQRLGAVPHHDRREGRVGPRLRHRGDRTDDRPRLRRPRAAPDRAVGLRVQRAGDPLLPVGRVRHRGPGPRGDLARRPVVGRDLDEPARLRLAARRTGRRGRRRRDCGRERADAAGTGTAGRKSGAIAGILGRRR